MAEYFGKVSSLLFFLYFNVQSKIKSLDLLISLTVISSPDAFPVLFTIAQLRSSEAALPSRFATSCSTNKGPEAKKQGTTYQVYFKLVKMILILMPINFLTHG